MSKAKKTAINPTREEDFPEWYQSVVREAQMAENSAVRGCMIIKPHGYALWERIQHELDTRIKRERVENAYFPLLIPMSYIAREAEHIDGFAKECAVVTHHKLEAAEEGGLKPAGELQEPYIIRPTSETIIGESMAKWIQSYRDLPLKLNQWCNVMRWEMRTRLFLRTAEFLWQEGHNAFATAEESKNDAHRMLDVYAEVAEDILAVPVIKGEKTADERFPGAIATYTIEAMMQDGKALQYATSHDLGQTFSKACDIVYQDKEGNQQHAWTTSWGLSTRTIGGLVMVHGDDDGLRLPPNAAPYQIVIIPFVKNEEDKADLFAYCLDLEVKLIDQGIRVRFDTSEARTPDKIWSNIKKGTPIRVEVGPKEMAQGLITVARRDKGAKDKEQFSVDHFVEIAGETLAQMQKDMLEDARKKMNARIQDVSSIAELRTYFETAEPLGFARMDTEFLNDPDFEAVKKEFSVTPRCLPFADDGEKVLIGKSY